MGDGARVTVGGLRYVYDGVWVTVCGYGALCGCVTGVMLRCVAVVRYDALRYEDSTNVH